MRSTASLVKWKLTLPSLWRKTWQYVPPKFRQQLNESHALYLQDANCQSLEGKSEFDSRFLDRQSFPNVSVFCGTDLTSLFSGLQTEMAQRSKTQRGIGTGFIQLSSPVPQETHSLFLYHRAMQDRNHWGIKAIGQVFKQIRIPSRISTISVSFPQKQNIQRRPSQASLVKKHLQLMVLPVSTI